MSTTAPTTKRSNAPGSSADYPDRAAVGREARARVPRSAHGTWMPAADRADPVSLLEEQATTRVQELVPIRHARMMVSPFTFYRGAALLMAADLADTPTSGITTQICGDAHLSNFGVFGTPERTLIFDINDFDETLPGPWEWDVKRLAASFEVAGRDRGFDDEQRKDINLTVARSYREQMRKAAESRVLDAWYDRLEADRLADYIADEQAPKHAAAKLNKRVDAGLAKARTKDSTRALAKLVEVADGDLRIKADPPLIVPLEDLVAAGQTRAQQEEWMRDVLASYQTTLQQENHPISDFTYVHMARKVVGVGSVGTRAWIVLLRGRDDSDPLLLQAKQAEASVLERFLGTSVCENHGERVVRGQRLMQAASDIFLGWRREPGIDGVERDFYLRQLHDWKGSAEVDTMNARTARIYARLCGETLARAHARSGDRVAIAAYLGHSDAFDRAIAGFATAYADQNERDYRAFADAVASGRLPGAGVAV